MVRTQIATIDFHVTSDCDQECPYCWGPKDYEHSVDTATALAIVERVREIGVGRIVFTGGDPLKRSDIAILIRRAQHIGLEVALSTTGDALTEELLDDIAPHLDLISLPLDGSSEQVNAYTKKAGHFRSLMHALQQMRRFPEVDVKVCTPVTKHNLGDVPNILNLVEDYASTTAARVFYNVFQTFPRAMFAVEWKDLVVSDDEFAELERTLADRAGIRVNFLSHQTLDRLYCMVFPDGSLVIPSGERFQSYGAFLEIDDLDAVIAASEFDSEKHLRHARGWIRSVGP